MRIVSERSEEAWSRRRGAQTECSKSTVSSHQSCTRAQGGAPPGSRGRRGRCGYTGAMPEHTAEVPLQRDGSLPQTPVPSHSRTDRQTQWLVKGDWAESWRVHEKFYGRSEDSCTSVETDAPCVKHCSDLPVLNLALKLKKHKEVWETKGQLSQMLGQTPLIPSLRRQQGLDLCEFTAN